MSKAVMVLVVTTPDYSTVKDTAEAWGVTRRYVNMCIEDGRIPGAVRMGNMWLVPRGADKPAGPRREENRLSPNPLSAELSDLIAATTMPLPQGNHAHLPGTASDRGRFQQESLLAYLCGDFERVKACFLRTEGDEAARLCICSITIAAAISTGDYPLYLELETYLKGVAETRGNPELAVFAELCLAVVAVSVVAPNMVPGWLKDGDFAGLLPQARPDALYKRAKYFQCLGKYESMLAVAQTALSLCDTGGGITFHGIYFQVVCAMACCGLGRMDEAKRWLRDALTIALPLGFITPFAESATAFGGLLEQILEDEYPAHYGAVTRQWERTFKNWRAFHNRFTKDNITLMLSLRDYELALLVARRVPYAKVAAQFHISVGTLNNTMRRIYGELFVKNREELSKYIL